MCRHPPSILNNLHKDSSRKSPKNALRVSPNPRKDVARLSSEGPMVDANECPQDTPQDLADATQELQLARQFALPSQGLPKSVVQECVQDLARTPQELSPIPGGIPKGLVENPQGLCETSKGLSKARAEIHKAFCTTFPRIPEAISRDWTQDVAKIPETLRNQHFPQVSPRILTKSPPTHFA